MATDRRPQDTEAIRAARRIRDAIWIATEPTGFHGMPNAQADVVVAWFAKREARLVARLEAAERERDEAREGRWDAVNQMLAARAALAAAAPGETEQTP